MRLLGLILIMLFLSACAFNKLYLRPSKLTSNTQLLKQVRNNDTVYIAINPLNFQPTYLKGKTDTMQFDYTIESVVFKSKNENELNGWLIKPKNVKPTTTIIHFHGNAGNILGQHRAMTPLLKFGFQIFVFDYSGFGFSTGKATRNNVLKDAHAAIDYIKTRNDISNTKLVIYGQSLGGHLSAVVASQRQDEIDALVIEGAFSSHKDIAADMAGFVGRILVSEKYSAIASISNIKKPILIIHSTQDETIPFKMGQKLFEKANYLKEFYEIKECHICGPRYYADSIAQKINRLLFSH
ncbi:MAG: alpha/beta fold hydrolase [Bacteroidia bacterium]|nr:alpha/beta fold hydrolase [Bacteroidia bacterium]